MHPLIDCDVMLTCINAGIVDVKSKRFYMSVCGNTAHQVSRESAQEMYEMGRKAIAKAEDAQ